MDEENANLVRSHSDDNSETVSFQWWRERTLWTRIWQGAAIACTVLNVVAVIAMGSAVMGIAGVVAIGVSCAVFYFQLEIQAEDSLRIVQNQLRHEVNRLNLQNRELHQNANRLGAQVSSLKEKETKLAMITKEQGMNVNTFVDLVKQNEETLRGLKTCVKAATEQTFLRAVLDSDFDQSNAFSDQEVHMLEYRLRSVPGITLHAELLKSKIQASDRSLTSVIQLLTELDNEKLPDHQRIFVVHEENLISH